MYLNATSNRMAQHVVNCHKNRPILSSEVIALNPATEFNERIFSTVAFIVREETKEKFSGADTEGRGREP